MNLFHNYLSFCLGNSVPACAFINLKKYETAPSPELEQILGEFYQQLKDSETIFKYPFLLGYHRHFRNYENIGTLLSEFLSKKEASLAYAQACFLALQVADEMLYDEYRTLGDVLGEALKKLLEKGIDYDKALILLASLYYKYIGPEFIEFIPKADFEYDLYKNLKEKVKERYPL